MFLTAVKIDFFTISIINIFYNINNQHIFNSNFNELLKKGNYIVLNRDFSQTVGDYLKDVEQKNLFVHDFFYFSSFFMCEQNCANHL